MEKFYYQSPCPHLQRYIRRTLGMYLFFMRQQNKIPAKKACQIFGIQPKTLDEIEIGRYACKWDLVEKMLKHYSYRVELNLIKIK